MKQKFLKQRLLSVALYAIAVPVLSEEKSMTYHHFCVIDEGDTVRGIEPVEPAKTPLWAEGVSPKKHTWPDPASIVDSIFTTPIPYVLQPREDSGDPFYKHNHCPALTWCENGDLLAIWFSTSTEKGTEMTILASRLRAGSDKWEPASEFFKSDDRNMTGSALFHDGKGKLFHFNGMGKKGVTGWSHLVLLLRTSTDNGVSWTAPRPISSGTKYQRRNQVVAGTSMMQDGTLLQICDALPGERGASALHISHDNGLSWKDAGGDIRGIHAGLVDLLDGHLMAFGRGQTINGCMPISRSSDLGKTWSYEASPFPIIGSGQRLILKRLMDGTILLVSFTDIRKRNKQGVTLTKNGMTFTDKNGTSFTGYGMYTALSFDDGKTWPVHKLLTPGEGEFNGGAWTGRFTATPTRAEHAGYLAATQTPDGVIHLISSRLYYRFNLAWLKEPNDSPRQIRNEEPDIGS